MQRDIGKPLFNIFLLVASASAFIAASALPNVEIPGDLSPAFFPKLLSALVFILAIPCLINDVREWRLGGSQERASSAVSRARSVTQWLFVVVLLIAYIFAFERFGYIASTASFTFCCVMGFLLISGAWKTLSASQKGVSLLSGLVFSVILAGAIFYVFTDLFRIPLPT